MRFKTRLFILFILSAFVTILSAQTRHVDQKDSVKVYQMPEIVVTANRMETLYDDVASTITVLTREELASEQLRTVAQALQAIAGLALANSGGVGKATSVFLRGANSDHTLVLLDGVELNDPSAPGNAYDFGALMVSDIEKIEVLHGAQSTLFGSNAIGGVINILTRSGLEGARFKAEAEAGGRETVRLNAGLRGGDQNFNYRITANRFNTEGFSISGLRSANNEKDGYQNTTISSKLNAKAGQVADLEFQLQFVDADGDLDHGGADGDDPNYTFDSRQLTAKTAARFSHWQKRWRHSLRASFVKHDREAVDLTDAVRVNDALRNQTKGERLKFEWQNNFFFSEKWVATLGLETENESAESSFHSESGFGAFDSEFAQQTARTTGVYAQNQFKPVKDLSANLGFRIDRHSTFGSKATWRSGLAYRIGGRARIKATAGTGFNAPTLFEIFDPIFGNIDLQPEESLTWDVGVDQSLFGEKLTVGVTYFTSTFDSMIGFDENFRSINIDKAEARGLEATLVAHPIDKLSLRANYAFVRTKDQSPESVDFGETLLRRPKHRAALNINLQPAARAEFNLGVIYSGARADKDFSAFPATRVMLASYLTARIAGSYRLTENVRLQARMENIFDEKYQEVLYFNTAGRTGYVGLQSTF